MFIYGNFFDRLRLKQLMTWFRQPARQFVGDLITKIKRNDFIRHRWVSAIFFNSQILIFLNPQDIREGMSNAYHIVRDGIGDTAQTIIQMAALEHDQKGYSGAVGAVMRQIPPTVVRPLVLVTQATTNVLGGLKNELIPNARIEAKEKWKDDDDN